LQEVDIAVIGTLLNGCSALVLAAATAILASRLVELRDRLADSVTVFWLLSSLLYGLIGLRQMAGILGFPRIDRTLFLLALVVQGVLSVPVASYLVDLMSENRSGGIAELLPTLLLLVGVAASVLVWQGGLGVYSLGVWGTSWFVNDRTALGVLTLWGLVPGAVFALAIPLLSFKARSKLMMYRLAACAISFLLALIAAYSEAVWGVTWFILVTRPLLLAAVAVAWLGHFPPTNVRRGLH
jgi:hypothetical protein